MQHEAFRFTGMTPLSSVLCCTLLGRFSHLTLGRRLFLVLQGRAGKISVWDGKESLYFHPGSHLQQVQGGGRNHPETYSLTLPCTPRARLGCCHPTPLHKDTSSYKSPTALQDNVYTAV